MYNVYRRILLCCYTLATNLNCVFYELLLWTDISSEHPIFIETVAKLTDKKLPKKLLDGLKKVNSDFSKLNKKTEDLKKRCFSHGPANPYVIMEIKKIIHEFFQYDMYFLNLLCNIMEYGKEDKVWQTLLHHIHHEQKFMYQLFTQLYRQL